MFNYLLVYFDIKFQNVGMFSSGYCSIHKIKYNLEEIIEASCIFSLYFMSFQYFDFMLISLCGLENLIEKYYFACISLE